jgi:hypothetical protein
VVYQSHDRGNGFLGFIFREGTSLIYAALILYAIWGGYSPAIDTPERAFAAGLLIGIVSLLYVGAQAFAVVSAPLARESRHLLDLLLSLVQLAVVGFAIGLNLTGNLQLNLFQKGVLWCGAAATVIDVVIFTWFNMKLNKLSSEFVPMR